MIYSYQVARAYASFLDRGLPRLARGYAWGFYAAKLTPGVLSCYVCPRLTRLMFLVLDVLLNYCRVEGVVSLKSKLIEL